MIDWSECPIVQRNPEYVSGAAALRADPRMTVDHLVQCADDGMPPEEISEAYRVPVATIRLLLDYAAKHRAAAADPRAVHTEVERLAPAHRSADFNPNQPL